MRIEDWIEGRLAGHSALTNLLTTYNKKPAVFYQEAPASSIIYWKNGKKYPQINYIVCKEEVEEGYQECTLKFRILATKDDVSPVLIEQALKECLANMVVQFEPGMPNYLTWLKTKALKQKEKEDLESNVIGMRVHFHMIEFPAQENMDPDPVQALSRFLEMQMPDMLQVGRSFTADVEQVSTKKPVCYIRFSNLHIEEETSTVIWLEGTISIHVLAVSRETRMKWMLLLLRLLSSNGEIEMSDYSPMWIKDVQMDSHVDYKREGQIAVTVRYGMPKYESKKPAIEHAWIAVNN